MMEVVNQDRHPYLCTQKEHQSNIEYIKTFQNAGDAINDSDGMAGATMRGINLVCQERGINYAALSTEIEQDGEMMPNPKKAALNAKAQERYLAALAASALRNKHHDELKTEITNKWVTEKLDIFLKNLVELHKITKGYVDNEVPRGKPRYDPNEASVALVGTGERRPCSGRSGAGQDMTGIKTRRARADVTTVVTRRTEWTTSRIYT